MVPRDGSSLFQDLEQAAAQYLYGAEVGPNARQFVSSYAIIRVADLRAWFREIELGLTSLTVKVDGDRKLDARLDLTGTATKLSTRIGRSGRRRIPLPRGLPDQAILVLSVDGDCTDFRYLGVAYGQSDPGIKRAAPDPASLLRSLILQGEGPTLEFKSKLPEGSKDSSRRPLLKTVAAFASGQGGTVLFGVGEHGQPNEGEVLGIDMTGAHDRVVNMIRSTIDPHPETDWLTATLDGKEIAALIVKADGRVYGLFPANPEYYIRRGANTFPAKVQELKEMMRSELIPRHDRFPFQR
jgi:hypothetical protein